MYIKSVNDDEHYESSGLWAPTIRSPGREQTSTKNLNKCLEFTYRMYMIWNNCFFTNYIHHIESYDHTN